jgi:hypothetical protein
MLNISIDWDLSLRTLKDRRDIKVLKIVHSALLKGEKIPSKRFTILNLMRQEMD